MSTTIQTSSSGISFAGLLTILFIALKLTNVIAWSWWWVLCPLWLGLAVGLGIVVIVLLGFLLAMVGITIFKSKIKPISRQSKFQEQLKKHAK